MKITTINKSFGYTLQLTSYHPVKFFSSITADIQEGDDVDECSEKLFEMAREVVKKQVDIVQSNKEKFMYKKESIKDEIAKRK